MIPLQQVEVAAPCSASWAEMEGTEQVRFCGGCRKNVYNLSAMSQEDAQALIQEKEGHLCVRFYHRADGTMLTRDCPDGQRAARFRLAKKCSYAAALLLACGVSLLDGAASASSHAAPRTHMVRARVRPHTTKRLPMPAKKPDNPRVFVTAGEIKLPPPPVEPPKPVQVPVQQPPPLPPEPPHPMPPPVPAKPTVFHTLGVISTNYGITPQIERAVKPQSPVRGRNEPPDGHTRR